jgi:hypothetical protein
MRGWFGLLVLAACSGGKGEDDAVATETPADTDTDADADADADTDTDTDTDTDVVATNAALSGVATLDGGAPAADLAVKLCRGLACRNGGTDGAGAYEYTDVHVDWHSFEIVPPEGYATVLAPLVFGDQETRTVDVLVPELDPATALVGAAAEIEAGEGLLVTVGSADLEPPLFEDPATEVAGVRVPESGRVPVDGAATVIDMWYLYPFNHTATQGGLPVRFENLWALEEGTTLEVWVGSYDESAWLMAGTVTVNGAMLEGNALLPITSTVALVQP